MLDYAHQFFKIRVVFYMLLSLFYISDTGNSLSDLSKNLKKIYQLEYFLANIINSWQECKIRLFALFSTSSDRPESKKGSAGG